MLLVYNLGIYIYRFAIGIAALFNHKAKLWVEGRKGWKQNLNQHFSIATTNQDSYIWFHCSSLGEFEQGRPLMEAIRKEFASHKIILTFFSPSGYEIRKNYNSADYICYLPLDTYENAFKFIQTVKPAAAFFVKNEFWYHYINILKKNKIPLYLVSAEFRKDQPFFKWYGNMHRSMLRAFSQLFVQSEHAALLLKDIHISQVQITGDTRYDRCLQNAVSVKAFAEIVHFCENRLTIVAGSTWVPEEKLLQQVSNDICIIIAPHDIGRAARIHTTFRNSMLYSEYKKSFKNIPLPNVLIIDNIGMLSSIYQYADITLVGGGFGSGLHNILEAAVFGKPALYGPKTEKFPEADALVKSGGGFYIHDANDFTQTINTLSDPEIRLRAGQASAAFVKQRAGATEKMMEHLRGLLA